jgi:hypothetical protein
MPFIWEQALITVDHPDQYQDLSRKKFCNVKGLSCGDRRDSLEVIPR